jgi:hypothetical protein
VRWSMREKYEVSERHGTEEQGVKSVKSVWSIALAVTITFLTSMALNFGLDFTSRDNGAITVGPRIAIEGKTYLPVTISNFSASPLDDLVLSVPRSVVTPGLISSDSIRVSDDVTLLVRSRVLCL